MKPTEWGKDYVQSKDFAMDACEIAHRYHRHYGYTDTVNKHLNEHVRMYAAAALMTTGPDSDQDFSTPDAFPTLRAFISENTELVDNALHFAIAYAHQQVAARAAEEFALLPRDLQLELLAEVGAIN